MSDDLTDRLREVTGGKLDYTNTPNSLRLAGADRIEELERMLGLADDQRREWKHHCKTAYAEALEAKLYDIAQEGLTGQNDE